MLTINELIPMSARAARLAVDYLLENLEVKEFGNITEDQADAFLTAALATIAYLRTYLKLQLPEEAQKDSDVIIERLSNAIVAKAMAATGDSTRKEA